MPERPHRNDRVDPRSTRGDLPTHVWPVVGDGRASDGEGRSANNTGDGRSANTFSGDGRSSARHSGDGRSTVLPSYSGDGHGRGTSDLQDLEPAIWFGENYSYYGGLLNSTPASASRNHRGLHSNQQVTYRQMPSASGDGQGKVTMDDIGKMEDVRLKVNVPGPKSASFPVDLKTKPTPASETWKLVCLVVIFLVWISTASTLLFLYMDRYLFP